MRLREILQKCRSIFDDLPHQELLVSCGYESEIRRLAETGSSRSSSSVSLEISQRMRPAYCDTSNSTSRNRRDEAETQNIDNHFSSFLLASTRNAAGRVDDKRDRERENERKTHVAARSQKMSSHNRRGNVQRSLAAGGPETQEQQLREGLRKNLLGRANDDVSSKCCHCQRLQRMAVN